MSKDLIMLIEDERSIADTSIYALERAGFQTIWCNTGEQGLRELKQHFPSLLLLDIGLPDCNGLDLFQEIRQHSNIPIIFLTARNEEVDRILGLELGADDYISKPFSPREMVARVRAVLRRHKTPRTQQEIKQETKEHIKIIGEFKNDSEQIRIWFQENALNLSRYEYRLLSLLLSHPNKVFSREEILNRAWEEPEMTTDRTVDAHIKSIRKKIKDIDNNADPIRTVRGVGYAMESS